MKSGDLGRLEIAVDLLSLDAVRLRPGLAVSCRDWGGGGVLQGRVRRIEPHAFTKVSALGVEEQRVWVIVDLDEDSSRAGLGGWFQGAGRFSCRRAPGLSAGCRSERVFRDEDGWALYAVDAGRARKRRVTTGLFGEMAVEILEGIEAGATVINYPPAALVDGSRVAAFK